MNKIKKWNSKFRFERELFVLSDGGTIAIDWYPKKPRAFQQWNQNLDSYRDIIVMMVGLSSNSDEYYVINTIEEAYKH